ncbi:MAG TPA: dipeptidase, partial [Bacteroidales bacterium]|nr:dipeptidase [Bacteroidales bacterium]
MKKLLFFIVPAAVLYMAASYQADACTNFIITKGATKDGSVMITYSADSHVLYGELYFWPARNWPAGSMVDIYEWDTGKFLGRIPQVA